MRRPLALPLLDLHRQQPVYDDLIHRQSVKGEVNERALRLAATRTEIAFVNAPVSGSKSVAEEGNAAVLSVFVGRAIESN